MKRITAQFSWQAPVDRFPIEARGSRQQIAGLIEEDARRLLLRHPGLEALSEHYRIPEASHFWIDGEPLPPKIPSPDIPGADLYRIEVRVEGHLFHNINPLEMFTWRQREVWDEICDRSNLLGRPERFQVHVTPIKDYSEA